MTPEGKPHYLKGIYLDLELQALVLRAPERSVMLRLTRHGILMGLLSDDDVDAQSAAFIDTPPAARSETSPAAESTSASEPAESAASPNTLPASAPTSVLTGRIQGVPVEGKPDRQKRPTAWARFLAHVDGQDGAMLLSTTFHGPTRAIALDFPPDAQITAQGYLHLRAQQEGRAARLSSLSVIHLLNYPGKPAKSAESEG